MGQRVGVEVGGTFTDLVWQGPDGRLRTHKVPSRPAAIHRAVMEAVEGSGADPARTDHFIHGSTVATNALLTRSGQKMALLTTRGFRDVIEIGTHDRTENVYQLFYRKIVPPVPRRRIVEVEERVDASGTVVRPLEEAAARSAIEALVGEGVSSFAIVLLHAYANPDHEARLRAIVEEAAPGAVVSASHEISPEFREYERTMTTVVNAFVSPVVSSYICRIEGGLRDKGYRGVLQIMQSDGGVVPANAAERNAVRMLLSGPAAGVRGAIEFARRNGLRDILTLDMGGTSTDVALAPGLSPQMVPQLSVDGLPIRTPAVDMVTVGAGGGSIAGLDPGGLLAVGPASAGADPGPAAYGNGGTVATVTDAQIAAGIIRPERFFGGRMQLDPEAAADALTKIGAEGEPAEVADAVLRVVDSNMAQALRLVSTARGIDPTDFTLVAYGGAGPLHAASVAAEIGIARVLIPWSPGLTSAFGLLVADVTINLVRTILEPLSDATLDAARLSDLRAAWTEAATAHGLTEGSFAVEIGLDLRYRGQAFELTVWGDDAPRSAADLRDGFDVLHLQRYGYTRAALPVEAVSIRTRLVEPTSAEMMTARYEGEASAPETRRIVCRGRAHEAAFVAREGLRAGERIAGPAVIEEATATTLVPPGWIATVTEAGDLLLERSTQ